ncbi:MAG: hypothetical protein ACQEQY_05275 [Halobacteriota archaeon]
MVPGSESAAAFGAVVLVLGTIVLAVSARYVWRASAVLRATSVQSLATVQAGTLVRVTGTASQGDTPLLVAPFSGRECLALRYRVEERRSSPALLPWFVTIHEVAGADGFRVRTPEATLDVVEPAHTVVLDDHVVATVDPGSTPPDLIARFEQRVAAIPSSTVWRNPPAPLRPLASFLSLGTRRYVEHRVLPGDEVSVVGWVTDGSAGIDPLVIADGPPGRTLRRMATTSLFGLAIGAFAFLLGVAVVLV